MRSVHSILQTALSSLQGLGLTAPSSSSSSVDGDVVDMETITSDLVNVVKAVGRVTGSEQFIHGLASRVRPSLSSSLRDAISSPDSIHTFISIRVQGRLSDDVFHALVLQLVKDEQLTKQVCHVCTMQMNEVLEPLQLCKCEGWNGSFVDLDSYIKFVFNSSKLDHEHGPFQLKFELDATTLSKTGKNINTLAFEIITPSLSTPTCMSPRNAHVFLVYKFENTKDEKNEGLLRLLKPVREQVNRLVRDKSLKLSDDVTISFEHVFMVSDMKAVCALLGLYGVTAPRSEYICSYCEIKRNQADEVDEMFNGTKRTLQSIVDLRDKRKDVNGEPIFNIEPEDYIFDLLHTEENVTRQLLGGTASLIEEDYQRDFEDALFSIGGIRARVHKALKQRGTGKWWKFIRDLKFNRNESLEVLGNYETLLQVLNQQQSALATAHADQEDKLMKLYHDAEFVWNQFRQFIVFFSCTSVDVSKVANWDDKMKKWLTTYRNIFPDNQLTTYIHMMVCHSRECLKKCGSLQRFACFALASKHVWTKEIYHNQTNLRNLEPHNILKYHILSEEFGLESEVSTEGRCGTPTISSTWMKI